MVRIRSAIALSVPCFIERTINGEQMELDTLVVYTINTWWLRTLHNV